MKTILRPWSKLTLVTLSIFAGLSLPTAVPVFAQAVSGGEALWPLIIVIFLVSSIPFYIYWAWATQTIARKTLTEKGSLAWVPIANFILWANIARKPIWWGGLCIIALVGLVFTALNPLLVRSSQTLEGLPT